MTPTSRKSHPGPQSLLFASTADEVQEASVDRDDPPKPPTSPAAWLVAYTDGGSRGNPGPAGYGVMLQAENGVPVAELSEFIGVQTNNVAEYSAMLGALQYALEQGHTRLRVISDSELMVKQIRGQYSVKSPDLRPLYEEAKRRIARLEKFEIQHVLRGKNKHADQLANDAMDRGMKRPSETSSRVSAGAKIVKPAAPAVTSVKASTPAPRPEIPIVRHDVAPVRKSTGPLRCIVRNGAIQLPENALPEGTVVIVMTEDALRGPR